MMQRLSIKTHPVRFLVVATTSALILSILAILIFGAPESDILRSMLTTLGNGWMAIIIYYFGTTDRTGGVGQDLPSRTTDVNVTQTTTTASADVSTPTVQP